MEKQWRQKAEEKWRLENKNNREAIANFRPHRASSFRETKAFSHHRLMADRGSEIVTRKAEKCIAYIKVSRKTARWGDSCFQTNGIARLMSFARAEISTEIMLNTT